MERKCNNFLQDESLKNIEAELKQLRYKVRILKESNKSENNNAESLLNWKNNLVTEKYVNSKIIKNKNEWETKFIDAEEVSIVANCYRKSLELAKKHFIEKKKKEIVKVTESAFNSSYENISTNCGKNSSEHFIKMHYKNTNNKSIEGNCNKTTNECDVINYPQCDPNINSTKKRKKTVEKNSSAVLKHTVEEDLQNGLKALIKMRHVNMENSLTDDVVFLKSVTHMREKKKSSPLPKETDENEAYNDKTFNVENSLISDVIFLKTVREKKKKSKLYKKTNGKEINNNKTVNAIDKRKQQHNTENEIECRQKGQEIKQKETDDPDIVFINTMTVSSPINALNVTDSHLNKSGIFPSELQIQNCLNDKVIEEDEPEIIIQEWDFTEEPVDFTVPILHIDENVNSMTKQKSKLLESKGITIKKGPFSKEEEALLIRNYKDFTSRFEINDARLLLGIGRFISNNKFENRNVQKFVKAKHFFVRLGKDLNQRTLHTIYRKARCLFNPLKYKKKSSHKDISLLLQLQKKYGNKWELIARKFGRSYQYCYNLYYENKKSYMKGNWSKKEVEKLIYAIKKITNSSCSSPQNLKIPWVKVSELVGTRNPKQCRTRWLFTKSANT